MTSAGTAQDASPWIVQIAHINLTVPEGSLELAAEFYAGTLGLKRVGVPELQRDSLAWFNLPADPSSAYPPQQIHIAFPRSSSELSDTSTRRHACFRLASLNALEELQKRIWGHYCARTGGRIGVEGSEEKRRDSAPMEADEPGQQNSGAQGKEYNPRFFARDYAGNRLEFSL